MDKKRNVRFDWGYENMWSLLDEIQIDELVEEKERLNNEINAYNTRIEAAKDFVSEKSKKMSVLKQIIKRRGDRNLFNILPTEEHKKLLKQMDFVNFENWGDYVFMWVEWKRPFWNSNISNDVANILGWELPNDDLSFEQQEKVQQLLRELPFVLNNLLKTI